MAENEPVPIPAQPPQTPGEPADNRRPDGTFGPGNNANPTGRPTGSFSIMTIIRKKMEEIPVGQVKAWKEQIADILLEKAVVKGDIKALEMIIEYMDGKPKQNIEVDVNRENVDALTEVLRAVSKTKEDGSNPAPTTTTPAPDSGGQTG